MSAVRVILVTVAGPGGHVDVGVRSDATPEELARSLSSVLGIREPWPAAEHRSPPRPGDPAGVRAVLVPGVSLADARVADGDLVLFRGPPGSYTGAGRIGSTVPAVEPSPADYPSVGGGGSGSGFGRRAEVAAASARDSVRVVPMTQDRPACAPPGIVEQPGDIRSGTGWPAAGSPADGAAGAGPPPEEAAAGPPDMVAQEPPADGPQDVRETYGEAPPAMPGQDARPADAQYPPPDVRTAGGYGSGSYPTGAERAGWPGANLPESGSYDTYADGAAADGSRAHGADPDGVSPYETDPRQDGSFGTPLSGSGGGYYDAAAYGPDPGSAQARGTGSYGVDPYGASSYGADQYGSGPYGADPYGADIVDAEVVEAEPAAGAGPEEGAPGI